MIRFTLTLSVPDAKKNDELIKSVGERLDGQELDLAIYLSDTYKVADTEQFFIKETILQRLKTVAAFLCSNNSNNYLCDSTICRKCIVVKHGSSLYNLLPTFLINLNFILLGPNLLFSLGSRIIFSSSSVTFTYLILCGILL